MCYMGVEIPTREGAIFRVKRGRSRTCPAVSVLKASQNWGRTGTVRMPIGAYEMGCTLASPGKYD